MSLESSIASMRSDGPTVVPEHAVAQVCGRLVKDEVVAPFRMQLSRLLAPMGEFSLALILDPHSRSALVRLYSRDEDAQAFLNLGPDHSNCPNNHHIQIRGVDDSEAPGATVTIYGRADSLDEAARVLRVETRILEAASVVRLETGVPFDLQWAL